MPFARDKVPYADDIGLNASTLRWVRSVLITNPTSASMTANEV